MSIKELVLEHAGVQAAVAPERGAIITRLSVQGREVFYLDRTTLEDPAKNVRGGIPLLFPFAGPLDGNCFVDVGTTIKQHGFARNRPWTVTAQRPGELRMELISDEETFALFPFTFRLQQSCTILPRGLLVELLVHNTSNAPLPMAPGWHPYFRCPSAGKPQVHTNVPGLDVSRFTPDAEFDFGVTAPVDGQARFTIPELGTLRVSSSPELRFLQTWSLPGKDFICLEPFTGPNNTLNTPSRLTIPPHRCHILWMRVELD